MKHNPETYKDLCIRVAALEVTHDKDVAAIRSEMNLMFANKSEKEIQAAIEIEKRLVALNNEADRLKLMIPRSEYDLKHTAIESKIDSCKISLIEKHESNYNLLNQKIDSLNNTLTAKSDARAKIIDERIEIASTGKVTWGTAMIITLLVGICSVLIGAVIGHVLNVR